MKHIYSLLLSFLLFLSSTAQVSVEQLDFYQSGPADPLLPLIFEFVVHVDSSESVQLLMIKGDNTIQTHWDVSLCTDACLPPTQDTAIFNVGAMDHDTVSVYFFMDILHQGWQQVIFAYADAAPHDWIHVTEVEGVGTAVTSLSEADPAPFRLYYDAGQWMIESELTCAYRLLSLNGQVVKQGRLEVGRNETGIGEHHKHLNILVLDLPSGESRAFKLPVLGAGQ